MWRVRRTGRHCRRWRQITDGTQRDCIRQATQPAIYSNVIQSITTDNVGLQQTTPDCNRQHRIATDNIDAFTELAKTLIEERGAEETLAGALACMTGPPTPPPPSPLSHAPSPSLPSPPLSAPCPRRPRRRWRRRPRAAVYAGLSRFRLGQFTLGPLALWIALSPLWAAHAGESVCCAARGSGALGGHVWWVQSGTCGYCSGTLLHVHTEGGAAVSCDERLALACRRVHAANEGAIVALLHGGAQPSPRLVPPHACLCGVGILERARERCRSRHSAHLGSASSRGPYTACACRGKLPCS